MESRDLEETGSLLADHGVNDSPSFQWEADLHERQLQGTASSPGHQNGIHRKTFLTVACALATAASLLLLSQNVAGSGRTNDLLTTDIGAPLGLFENVTEYGECSDYPYVKFHKVLRNNLGNQGPDSGDEGLIFNATVNHTGAGLHNAPIQIEIHNTSEYHTEGKGWSRDWNGLHGHFASIALKHGTNASFEMTARLPGSKETLTFPRFGMSVFDLDVGPNGGVEYVELSDFDHFYVTADTLVKVHRDGMGTARFTATIQGNGTDNPDNPELLTLEHKHKSVTVEYSNVQKVPIKIGAIGGSNGRVFSFTARPILLCAKTKTANGNLDPGEKEIIEIHSSNGTATRTQGTANGNVDPGEKETKKNHTIKNHTANGTKNRTQGSGTRECDAGFLGLVLFLSLSLLTT